MKTFKLLMVLSITLGICFGALSLGTRAQRAHQPQPAHRRVERGPGPTLFGEGVISTGDMELNAAFTPDGRTIYFTKRTPRYQLWVIMFSHFRGGRWSAPQVASSSGQYGDFDPFISPDGSKLFFSSNRPVNGRAKQDFDIWMVEREKDTWGSPINLGAPINAAGQEYYPSVTNDGTLYFSSTREGGWGSGDIYRSRFSNGKYSDPESRPTLSLR